MADQGMAAKPKKRKKKHETGAAIGAAIVGFEQAVFRKLPPPIEVVAQARHRGPVAAADGTSFTIVLPGEPARAGTANELSAERAEEDQPPAE